MSGFDDTFTFGSEPGVAQRRQAEASLIAAREANAARVAQTKIDSDTRENLANIAAGNVRGSGLLTKFRPTSGWSSEGPGTGGRGGGGGGAPPNLADASLGAPTSFNAGAGAPPAAEVIRGRNVSFTNPAPEAPGGGFNPTPGTGTQEFATPQQAGQAFNRGQLQAAAAKVNPNVTYPAGTNPVEVAEKKFGTYVPPEGPKLQAAAAADVTGARAYHTAVASEKTAGANAENLAANKSAFRTQFLGEHGEADAATPGTFKMPADQNLGRIYKRGEALIHSGTHSPQEAYEAILPDLHKHYYTPDNITKALDLRAQQTGQPVTDAVRNEALSNPQAPALLYPYIKQAVQQPKPGLIQRLTGRTSPNLAMAGTLPGELTAP